jgi:hypothetical protein
MAHLLICDESVVNVPSPSSSASSSSSQREKERQTKWRYCTGGAYQDLELCDSIPFVRNNSNMNMHTSTMSSMLTKYTERMNARGTRGEKQIAYFFVANCEVWGTSLGGTRDQEACGLPLTPPPEPTNTDSTTYTNTTGGVSSPCQPMEPSDITLNIDLTYTNPNGFLSFTETPFIPIYSTFLSLWFVVTILWEYNIYKFAKRNHIVTLQKRMALVPVLRFGAVTLTMILWVQRDAGKENSLLLVILILVQVVYKYILAEVMLLISKGWQITRAHLHVQEERNVRGLLLLYSFAWTLYYLSSTTLRPTNGTQSEEGITPDGRNMQVAFVGLIVLTIMFLVVLYSVWYSVSMQLNVLSYQINLIRAYNINPRSTPVWIKFHMLRRFRQAFALYLLMNAVADVMIAAQRRAPWAASLADECLEFVCCIIVGFTFRARDFSPYFARIRRASLDPSRATSLEDSNSIENNNINNNNNTMDDDELLRQDQGMREWQRGMALPEAPYHMFHPSRSSIVVFMNPDGRRSSLGATPSPGGVPTPTSPGSFIIKPEPPSVVHVVHVDEAQQQEIEIVDIRREDLLH